MKTISIALLLATICSIVNAQQVEGKVIYLRTMQMQITINDNDEMQKMLPKTRTDKFELAFSNNQSLWKHVDEEEVPDEVNQNGLQIKMMTPGQNDVVFYDFNKSRRIEQRDIMERKFIVSDSIGKLNWKLTGETQSILGHVCQKATAQRTGKRMQMNIDNGKMERKEINDTTNMIAWFTTDIPVPAGPEVQGQLPGLILGLEMNDGRVSYKAIEISPKVDVTTIKEPTKGKKVTAAEFVKEREKMMMERQKNNEGSGNRVVRIQD